MNLIMIHLNLIFRNFDVALRRTRDLLPPMNEVHVCIGECMLFTGRAHTDQECKACGEHRYLRLGSSQPRRIFIHYPIHMRMDLFFGHPRLAPVADYLELFSTRAARQGDYGDVPTGRAFEEVVIPLCARYNISLRDVAVLGLSYDGVKMTRLVQYCDCFCVVLVRVFEQVNLNR